MAPSSRSTRFIFLILVPLLLVTSMSQAETRSKSNHAYAIVLISEDSHTFITHNNFELISIYVPVDVSAPVVFEKAVTHPLELPVYQLTDPYANIVQMCDVVNQTDVDLTPDIFKSEQLRRQWIVIKKVPVKTHRVAYQNRMLLPRSRC